MREILFKAKTKGNNEWVYGWIHRGLVGDVWYLIEEYDSKNIEIIPETICEYTGLTDKVGNKIFEGDILREYGNEIEDWVVSYDCGEFGGTYDNIWASLNEISDLEVIGNIFDES